MKVKAGTRGEDQRHQGGRGAGDDGLPVDPPGVGVVAVRLVRVQVGYVHPALPHQPVVGHDDAEQGPEQGAEPAQEVDDDRRRVVQVPGQDHQADDGGDYRRAAEVQFAGEQVGQRVDGGDEVRHQVHRDGEHDQRQAGQHEQERVGDRVDDVRRGLDDVAVQPVGATGEDDDDRREEQHVDRDAEEVAADDGLLGRRTPGEIAEVEHEGAVDHDPQGGGLQDPHPHLAPGQGARRGPGDPSGLGEHPDGQGQHGDQDDRAGERLVLADHLHPEADDDHLHHPQDQEGDPAQGGQAEDGVGVQGLQAGGERDDEYPQHHGGEVGLDAEPDHGHATADHGGDLRAVDPEGDPAQHRERDAQPLPHEAGEVEQGEEQGGAEQEHQHDLPAPEPEGEQPDREGVVAQGVHVVGPEREDAVGVPGATPPGGRGQVAVVEPGADAERDRGGGAGHVGDGVHPGVTRAPRFGVGARRPVAGVGGIA